MKRRLLILRYTFKRFDMQKLKLNKKFAQKIDAFSNGEKNFEFDRQNARTYVLQCVVQLNYNENMTVISKNYIKWILFRVLFRTTPIVKKFRCFFFFWSEAQILKTVINKGI